jgi:hypothetical protein
MLALDEVQLSEAAIWAETKYEGCVVPDGRRSPGIV